MDCCGHGHVAAPQPWVWNTPPVSVGAMLAGGAGPRGSTAAAQTAETAAAALAVLRNAISVDVHSHGGSTGITSKAPPSGDLAEAMRVGSLAVACLADVPDWLVLERSAEGGLAAIREPAPGELYRYHLDRLTWLDELVADHRVRRALNAADLEAAHKAGEPAIIADVEGLDFLEGKLERLEGWPASRSCFWRRVIACVTSRWRSATAPASPTSATMCRRRGWRAYVRWSWPGSG